MKKLMIMTATLAALSGTAYAADVTGEVGVDLTKNANDKFVASTELDLGFSAATEGDGFVGGFGLIVESNNNNNVAIDNWHVGYVFGNTKLTFGDQGDLFDFGGLEVVGGDTLVNPADDHESLIVVHNNMSAMLGFSDIGSDMGDVENAQFAYTGTLGAINTVGAIDYNFNTEDVIVGVSGNTQVAEKTTVGLAVTYSDLFAYEATVGYNAFTGYVNGDENDALQNVGVGYSAAVHGADVYAEVGYNIDTEEVTPAVGLSIKF